MKKVVFAAMILLAPSIMAQETQEDINKKTIDSLKSEFQVLKEMMTLNIKREDEKPKSEKWYDKISFGGYMQIRYNELFETNPDLVCEQCDSSWGKEADGIEFRRLRFKFA